MNSSSAKFTVFSLVLLLSGCCYFMPCHPGSHLVGVVQSSEGAPIENATVSLYGTSRFTGRGGCFSFGLADALPFTLSASVAGYEPFEEKAKRGVYRVTIVLEPTASGRVSKATWQEISNEEYERENKICP